MNDSSEEVVVTNPSDITLSNLSESAAFGISLKRSYSQIRKDRADDLTRKTFIKYKRKIEDIDEELYSLVNQQDNMLDLAPAHTQSLIPAGDFNAEEYLVSDLDLAMRIRNIKIQSNIVRERCNYLFGTNYPLLEIKY